MPKKIDHDQRKKEILREAVQVFSEKGYEATTLADIAKAAGIARPTLYQYFRNKHQILFFSSKQFTDEFLIYYEKIIQLTNLQPLHRLRFILSHIVLSCREKRRELVSQSAFILKLEQEGRSIGDLVHKRTRPLKNLLSGLFSEAGLSINKIDLLLALVTSGIVHVLLFPAEGCDSILENIATVLALLSGKGEEHIQNDDAYWRDQQVLSRELEQLRQQDKDTKTKYLTESPSDSGLYNDEILDDDENEDEWNAFLDPFRSVH